MNIVQCLSIKPIILYSIILKTILILFTTYLILIAFSCLMYFSGLIPSFDDVGHLAYGCYKTNAMLPYIECRGLFLNSVIRYLMNLWFPILWAILYIQHDMRFLPTIIYNSLPFIYITWYILKGRHLIKQYHSDVYNH